MQRCSVALALSLLVACGGGGSNPDAPPGTPDGTPAIDGPAVADARPDADVIDADTTDADTTDADTTDADTTDAAPTPDASSVCFQDLCLNIVPVDGNPPPPGRLAAAWVNPGAPGVEVAYDIPWPADQVTSVDMNAFATPSAAFQFDPGICPGVLFSFAMVVASTDPDGNGAITADEIENGADTGATYGVIQAIVARTSAACPPSLPDFPEGFPAGVHVYTIDTPVMRLDGTLVDFQTCTPNTAACADINTPF